MTTGNGNEIRICDAIWSIGVMLDYTDKIAGYLTEELLDWRPQYPAGDYAFSIGEQFKHITDTRIWLAGELSGKETDYERWAAPYPGRDAAWSFREGSLAEVMEHLKMSRGLVQPWIELPMSQLAGPTAGTIKVYEGRLAAAREKGEDTSPMEAKGPASLASCLFFLAAHENGHRVAAQTLLRQAGAPVERMA